MRRPVVPMTMGIEAHDVLRSEGYRVECHECPMEHEVCGEEIAEVERWLRKRLVGHAS